MSFITKYHKPPYDQLYSDDKTNTKILINRKYPPSSTQIFIKNPVSFICMKCLLEGRLEQIHYFPLSILPTDDYESFTLEECKIHGETRYAEF